MEITEARKALLSIPPQTDEELYTWMSHIQNVKVPRWSVCEDHSAPFQFVSDAYFSRFNDAIVIAARGSGKTLASASLAVQWGTLFPDCEITVAGSNRGQALLCHKHAATQVLDPIFAGYVDPGNVFTQRIGWQNGSLLNIVTQSISGVSGPHPQKAIADEVEEWDLDVYDHFQGTARSKGNITNQIITVSTRHREGGLMGRLWEEAPDMGKKQYVWCLLDVMAPCKICQKENCPLWEECQGKVMYADGYLSLADAIIQKKRFSPASWKAQGLCRMTVREDAVYAEYIDTLDGHLFAYEYNQDVPVFWGMDFGYQHPAVILFAQIVNGIIYVFDEITVTQERVPTIAAQVVKKGYKKPLVAWSGTDRPDTVAEWHAVTLPSGEKESFNVNAIKGDQRSIYAGIQSVKGVLVNAMGEKRLFIHPRCTNLRKDLRSYSWTLPGQKVYITKEHPAIKQTDHHVEALRYLVVGLQNYSHNYLYVPKKRNYGEALSYRVS
jgi:hypothetical protein